MATIIEDGEALVLLPPAPPIIPPPFRNAIFVDTPAGKMRLSYAEATVLHYNLGQDLARNIRDRGNAPPEDPDIGGTPIAVAA